jgi:AcrR family transcriptional regulator
MAKSRDPASSLKEACVQAAREVIAEHGVESLSMRDVARKLDISHQAPYRHFESRDHLLAEIMRRCFADFAAHLDAQSRSADPCPPPCADDRADLAAMGEAYLAYAKDKPLEYRLMFGTPWPEPAMHAGLVADAVHAFDLLRNNLRRRHGTGTGMQARADLDALFIWSSMHGLTGVMHHNLTCDLDLSPQVTRNAAQHVMSMISNAMAARLQSAAIAPPAAAPRPKQQKAAPIRKRTVRADG